MRSQVAEYSYLKEISKKYSDRQAIAQRVGKQIKKSSGSIKGIIQTYNGIFRLYQPITFAQVADLSNYLYHVLDDQHSTDKQKIPMSVKRKAVFALNMLGRVNITTKEMKNTIECYEVQASLLHNLNSNLELHQPRSLKEEGLLVLYRGKKSSIDSLSPILKSQFAIARRGYIDIPVNQLTLSEDEEEEEEQE